jgi:hypothetical protein
MAPDDAWRALFLNWPAEIPKQGIVTTALGENVPFVGFALAPGLLLVERDKPDALGARKMIIPYSKILAVKLGTPASLQELQPLGFKVK